MKKRRNFLTIISSILGCVAICGFSLFGLLTRSNEKVQSKATISTNVLFRRDFNNSINYIASNGSETNSVKLVFDGFYVFEGRLNDDYSLNTRLSYTFNSISLYMNGSSVPTSMSPSSYNYQGTWQGNDAGLFELTTLGITSFVSSNQIAFSVYLNGSVYSMLFGSIYPLTVNTNLYFYSTTRSTVFSFEYDGDYDQYALGYNDGKEDGYEQGYNQGQNIGYNNGYEVGFSDAQADLEEQIQNAYNLGKADGYSEGLSVDSTATTIISGIFQVALVPINFFLGIFNFEILGINFTSLIQVLFTIAITIIIVKAVFGKEGD